ncbi:MAG TPA: hypothetical protein VMR49_02630 [Candidatus Paceibacterota bacterium]|jgi:hypothetical protein|nr:hypothetical protein [Candidatus Paceibacterota bacterium]
MQEKYSYLDYKICLSLLKSIKLKNGRLLEIQTIEDAMPMDINHIDVQGISIEDTWLIHAIIDDKKTQTIFEFGMINNGECFVSRQKYDEDHDFSEDITDYGNAVWKFCEIIHDYRRITTLTTRLNNLIKRRK